MLLAVRLLLRALDDLILRLLWTEGAAALALSPPVADDALDILSCLRLVRSSVWPCEKYCDRKPQTH